MWISCFFRTPWPSCRTSYLLKKPSCVTCCPSQRTGCGVMVGLSLLRKNHEWKVRVTFLLFSPENSSCFPRKKCSSFFPLDAFLGSAFWSVEVRLDQVAKSQNFAVCVISCLRPCFGLAQKERDCPAGVHWKTKKKTRWNGTCAEPNHTAKLSTLTAAQGFCSSTWRQTGISNFVSLATCCAGVLVRKRDKTDEVAHAPFVLLPSPFLKKCFYQACEVQRDVALLLHRVAYDHDFLKTTLQK